MTKRSVTQIALLIWAVIGVLIAAVGFLKVNEDARLAVGIASVLGPTCAVVSAKLMERETLGDTRLAGLGAISSALITPTYFAAGLNLPALLGGIILLVRPQIVFGETQLGRPEAD